MTFTPTSTCPIYPPGLNGKHPLFHVTDLWDTEIDAYLERFITMGFSPQELPKSQYGRRFLVYLYTSIRSIEMK